MPRPVSSIFGKILHRILGLLGHVHRVLETHHREEGQRGRRGHGHEGVLVLGGVERHHPREVDIGAAGERPQPHQDHQQQAADLDDRQEHVELDAFAHPTQIDQGERDHEEQRQRDDTGLAPS